MDDPINYKVSTYLPLKATGAAKGTAAEEVYNKAVLVASIAFEVALYTSQIAFFDSINPSSHEQMPSILNPLSPLLISLQTVH